MLMTVTACLCTSRTATWSTAVGVALWVVAAGWCASAQQPARTLVREPAPLPFDPEQLYLQELRALGLEDLAAEHCREQLRHADRLKPSRRALYAIVLSDILARQASDATSAAKRQRLWAEAAALLTQLLAKDSAGPHTPAVRYQLAQLELAAAQLDRLRLAVSPDNAELRASARHHLSQAVKLLGQVDRDLQEQTRSLTPAESAVRSVMFVAIEDAARQARARTQLELALLHEPGSPARIRAAREAIRLLEPLVEHLAGRRDDPLARQRLAEARLMLAEAYLLANEHTKAHATLNDLTASKPPTEYLDRALVLRARLHAAQNQWQKVYAFVRDARDLLETSQPELELLFVEACLRLAVRRGRVEAARFLQEGLLAAEELGNKHGAYWRARAAVIVADLLPDPTSITDPALLLRLAEVMVSRQDASSAERLYRRVVELTPPGSAIQRQAALGMARALRAQGRLQEAADALADIARRAPASREAAQGLLEAAYCYAQLYRAKRSQQFLDRYEDCLEQLVAAHRHRPEGRRALALLARYREAQSDWLEAARLYRQLAELDDEQASEAVLRAARCYRIALQRLWQGGQRADQLLSETSGFLAAQIRLLKAHGKLDEARAVGAELAIVYTSEGAGRYREALELMETLFGPASLSSGQLDSLRAAYLVALLQTGRLRRAEEVSRSWSVGDLALAVSLLERLSRLGAASRHEQVRRTVGQVQLTLLKQVPPPSSDGSADRSLRLRLELVRGMALWLLGRQQEAEEVFARLEQRLESDPQALLAYARNLSALGQFRGARRAWRRLGRIYRPPSPVYYEAKYELARACLKLGDADQARKIIETLEVLHPSMGGPEWKARFRELKADVILHQ